MAKMKPVSHDERFTIVEHLEELRTRLFVSLGALVAAFVLCFWQNKLILDALNDSLPKGTRPITFSVAEPFMTTVTVAGYAAVLLALPVILFQIYAYVLPALKPREKTLALPILLLVPALFIGGVVFGYYIVVPAAIKFLLGFNSGQFNIQVRARDYYGFVGLTLMAMGIVFQVPVAVVALTKLGIVSIEKLRKQRPIAYVVIAIVAAALPGTDPITMMIEMVPLLALYELGILLASFVGRPRGSPTSEVPS